MFSLLVCQRRISIVGYILTPESNQFSVKRLAKSTEMYFLYLSHKEMTVHTELRKNNKPTSAD